MLSVKGHGKMFWRIFAKITLHHRPNIREEAHDFGNGNDKTDTIFTEITSTDVSLKDRD